MKKKILIVVGSTGGHYFPGITLGEKIKEMKSEVYVFFAGEHKLKNLDVWRLRKLCFVPIPVLKRPHKAILFPMKFFQAIFVLFRNLLFIMKTKPDLVVCLGSYTSLMIGLSAKLMKKPVITHEQNFVPGLANKILNFIGIPVAISFSETTKYLKKTIHTGLPIRKEFLSESDRMQDCGLLRDKKTIIVIGGSQGASFINNLVLNTVEKLKQRYQFIHITGRFDYERVSSFYRK
ncbi:MAG: UDP-N-acetylglucosamine--N-acetylmuramyl-(pentapeptide) pyrophosphoryl-undecaprenol N-acetylglucosamine transferase, partial [Candidatus Omnitrophica bacterium]|nr:UDP-N-acetylglucosamine--N-acetylmuramyl-(pentapeptide) pyrophosphoryl-undecaprenol N-acetylglucosamine transferase [Candidatus Omnitrophota bacterium]